MIGSTQRANRTFILLWVIPALMPAPWALAVDQPSATDPGWASAWSRTVDLVERGEFVEAKQVLADVPEPREPLAKVSGWLEELLGMERSRAALTQADFNMYVERAQKRHADGKFERALEYALLAYHNTPEKDAFTKESWLARLRDDATVKAGEHRAKNEWLDAHAIYFTLNEIFEHDEELRRLRSECLARARLDAFYDKDNKWDEALEGIDPEMVKEALWRIDQKYVEEADFRRMTEAGLKQILLLAETPPLLEAFELLADEARRTEFVRRVGTRLLQVEEAESLSRSRSVDYFSRMLKINEETVQLPESLLSAEFLNGCLEELDEFTSVIWPAEYREFQKHTEGNFIGVGISIRQKYNKDNECEEIVVVSPLEDTPAYRAGIQADDVIVKVDGKSLCELDVSLNKAVQMITGPEDTSVTLTIRRPSDNQEIDIKLTRKEVEIHSVKGISRSAADEQKWDYLVDPELGIGYARVTNFQKNTVPNLRAVMDLLRSEHNLRGFILDLRFDPGGLLNAAVDMAELFLGGDETIVSTRGLRSRPWKIPAMQDGPFKDLPLIVLVNESSASASEIVAGAIKDHDRGLIVGERTFGKFSVQNLIQLVRSDAHLKLTTAHYYLPSGRSLHREEDSTEWGVEPDIRVPVVPKEMRKIFDIRRKADVLGPRGVMEEEEDLFGGRRPNGPSEKKPTTTQAGATDRSGDEDASDGSAEANAEEEEEEPDPNNRPEVDPQLETALLVMRVWLLSEDFPVIAQRPTDDEIVPRTERDVVKRKAMAE